MDDNNDHIADVTPLFNEEKLDALREVIGEEKCQALLDALSCESSKLLRKIQDALAAGDLDTARKSAHCLKGMAGNFGATRVSAIALQIETEVAKIEDAEQESESLELAIEQTRRWIAKSA